jgi:apolipoprotein N-acyltransferase
MLSPFFDYLKLDDFIKNILIKGFTTALLFSAFIYFEHFDLTNIFFNTIFITFAYILIITIDKKSLFFAGFFTGILWFWWVSMSFTYYDLIYLMPFIVLLFGIVYGVLFYLTAIIDKIVIRAILFYLLVFIEPFGFNWFKPDLPLINTYYNTYNSNVTKPNIKIYMPQYNTNQNLKWEKEYKTKLIEENLQNIDYAIKNKYDLIILPETTFPLALNMEYELLEILQEKSRNISIITGALSYSDEQFLNSTYLFQNGEYKIANKVVLVPFGEATPLPQFLVDFINNTFFDGASDYTNASEPTTFEIEGIKFRNAICYEATSDDVYKQLDTKFVIATSNNAWFTPSIEPTLQKLLLKYYAKKYNLIIYHSVNGSKNEIIF